MSRKRTIDAFFGAAGASIPKPKKPRDISDGLPETSRDDTHLDGLDTSSNHEVIDDAVSAKPALLCCYRDPSNLRTKIMHVMADLIRIPVIATKRCHICCSKARRKPDSTRNNTREEL